jgi:hypothetical protein
MILTFSIKSIIPTIFLFSIIVSVYTHSTSHDHTEINKKIDNTKIMYGSTIRIKAIPFNY